MTYVNLFLHLCAQFLWRGRLGLLLYLYLRRKRGGTNRTLYRDLLKTTEYDPDYRSNNCFFIFFQFSLSFLFFGTGMGGGGFFFRERDFFKALILSFCWRYCFNFFLFFFFPGGGSPLTPRNKTGA